MPFWAWLIVGVVAGFGLGFVAFALLFISSLRWPG
jgi:hypothetical protein